MSADPVVKVKSYNPLVEASSGIKKNIEGTDR